MHVTRIADAKPYDAPRHFAMVAMRLQGQEVSPATSFWMGISHLLPGGGAEESASALERVYVVLEGEVEVTDGEGVPATLGRWDSVLIPAGEQRAIANRSGVPASMLVAMPYPTSSSAR